VKRQRRSLEYHAQLKILGRNPAVLTLVVLLPMLLVPTLQALNPRLHVLLPGSPRATFSFGSTSPSGARPGTLWPYAQYIVPALAAFCTAACCFSNSTISLVFARESGRLKHLRATPLRASTVIASRVLPSVALSVATALVTLGWGRVLYSVNLPLSRMPIALAVLILGSGVFSALCVALTAVIPSAEAAAPASLAVLLPLGLISGSFFPPQLAPDWMRTLSSWLPLRPFSDAIVTAFNPGAPPWGFVSLRDLLTLLAWGGAAVLCSVRWFRWAPFRQGDW
jgi:ABC-2 type transport system permease protein